MAQFSFRAATRRYHYLFWPLMAAYVVILFACSSLIDKETAPLWLKLAGALATALPIAGTLYAIRRFSEETDEYNRMLQIRALRDGGLITAGIAFLVGFLQIFGAAPAIDAFWFGPLFFVGYGIGACAQVFANKA